MRLPSTNPSRAIKQVKNGLITSEPQMSAEKFSTQTPSQRPTVLNKRKQPFISIKLRSSFEPVMASLFVQIYPWGRLMLFALTVDALLLRPSLIISLIDF